MNLDGSDEENFASSAGISLSATPMGLFISDLTTGQLELLTYDRSARTAVVSDTDFFLFCVTRNWILYKNVSDSDRLWVRSMDGSIVRRLEETV